MSSLRVKGGVKLSGEITPQGAKNEALQVICATLLSDEDIIISNVPDIIDVVKLIDILRSVGVQVNELDEGKYSFNSKKIDLRSGIPEKSIVSLTGTKDRFMFFSSTK